jgi:hypothetical protein
MVVSTLGISAGSLVVNAQTLTTTSDVTISGSGFVPGELYQIWQCPIDAGGSFSFRDCSIPPQPWSVTAGADGTLRVQAGVLQYIGRSGEVDCAATPQQCAIAIRDWTSDTRTAWTHL